MNRETLLNYVVCILSFMLMGSGLSVAQDRELDLVGDELEWGWADGPARLVVAGPGELYKEQRFQNGERLAIELGDGPDGRYRWRLETSAMLGELGQAQTGSILRKNGQWLTPFDKDFVPSDRGAVDLIADHACIGPACADSEPFGDELVRLKGEAPALAFLDTAQDADEWHVHSNGGLLSAENLTSNTIPITLEGAPDHSLYVRDTGDVGLGTNTPAEDLHITSGDVPTVRFEQDSTGGSDPQVWDLSADEEGFALWDRDEGTRPFTIAAGAPTDSLHVSAQGDTTLGKRLHMITENNRRWSLISKDNALQISRDGTKQIEFELSESGDLTTAGSFNVGALSTTALDLGQYSLSDDGDLTISGGHGALRLREDQPQLKVESTNLSSGDRTLLHLGNHGAPILQMEDLHTQQAWNLESRNSSFAISKVGSGQSELLLNDVGDLNVAGTIRTPALHVGGGGAVISGDDGSTRLDIRETGATPMQRILLNLENNGYPTLSLKDTNLDTSWALSVKHDGFHISRNMSGVQEFFISRMGNVVLAGNLTVCVDPNACTPRTTYPDYVFDDGYELMPLGALKLYIEQNRHLPNVPTVEDVSEQGIDMTKLQLLLLEKVEELTLYTLEQYETLGRQQELLDTQQQHLEDQAELIQRLEARLAGRGG